MDDDEEEARRDMVDGSKLNMFWRRVEVRLAWKTQVAAARKETKFGGNSFGLVGRGEEFGGAFRLGEGDHTAVKEQLFGLRIVRYE